MRTAAALAAVLLTATGCGGPDDEADDGPDLGPSTPTTSSGVDDEAAIKATIADYDKALVTLNESQDVTPALEAAATDDWAQQLFSTYDDNLFAKKMVMTGRWHTVVDEVHVDGDRATAEVCSDGNKVYVIERGGTIPSGATSQGRVPGELTLAREDGAWQVAGSESEEGSC